MFNDLEFDLGLGVPANISNFLNFKDMSNYTRPLKIEYPDDMGDWLVINDSVKFSQLADATYTEFNGVLYAIGGKVGSDFSSIVYYSLDKGKNWLRYKAPFSGRSGASAVVFGSYLYLLGGETSDGLTNEVWRSYDGKNWGQVITSSSFTARKSFMVTVFNSAIIVAGGTDSLASELWKSLDGVNWSRVTASLPFSLEKASMAVLGENLLVVGGVDGVSISNSVYSSSDLSSWSVLTVAAFPSGIHSACLRAFNGVLFLFGGKNGTSALGDVYGSTDGITWSNYFPSVFSPRGNLGVSLVGGYTSIYGGSDDTYGVLAPFKFYLDGIEIPSGSSFVLWDSSYHELSLSSIINEFNTIRFCTVIGGFWEEVTSLSLHEVVVSGDLTERYYEGTSCILHNSDQSGTTAFDVQSSSFDGTNTTIVTTSDLSSGDFVCPLTLQQNFTKIKAEPSATFLSEDVEKFLNLAALKPQGKVIEVSQSLDLVSDRVFCGSFYSGGDKVATAVIKEGDFRVKLKPSLSFLVKDESDNILIDESLSLDYS